MLRISRLLEKFMDPLAIIGVLLGSFVLSFIMGSLVLQSHGAKAATGLGLVSSSTMTLSANSGTVSMQPSPTANSGLASNSSTLTANTNVPTGYSLGLSATSAGTALTATTGTIASPIALVDNTWGYALAKASAVGITNGFDTSYATPTPSTTSKWANPTTAATIKNTNATATNDTTGVYYAAKVAGSLTASTYSSTVTYTATANISNISAPSITSISPSSGSTAGGTAVTIVGTGFTANDKSVTTAVTIGGTACTSISISSNTPSTGKDTIYCNTPARTTVGAVNVAVTTWKSTATLTNGYTYATPTATITAPTANQYLNAGTTSTTLSVTTNYSATCYYGSATNPTTAMSTTGGTSHSVSITGLTNGSTITRYVCCNAASGHPYSTDVSVTFYVRPTSMQTITRSNCPTTRTRVADARDNKTYWIQKLADDRCWMLTNLAYAGGGTNTYGDTKSITNSNTEDYTKPYYMIPTGSNVTSGVANPSTSTSGTGQYGYLYNWCAAMGAQTSTAACSNSATPAPNTSISICPSGWRLPTGGTGGEFQALNATVNSGSTSSDSGLRSTWLGMRSGYYYNATFMNQSTTGNYWSSTLTSNMYAAELYFYNSHANPAWLDNSIKSTGLAVRCVLHEPAPSPWGSNPKNISSTNPAVIGVYPTTGWAGDVVAITSNAQFTSVSAVTIGGTACSAYTVVSTSHIDCMLPSGKSAGSSNAIAVTSGGTNVTNVSTYTHMKVTYFNPSTSTVNIGSNFAYYPNGFTSANCAALTANNTAPLNLVPTSSTAYVRDVRNNQVYRVKKMIDNKCWMVDNLKYTDFSFTYNNGDHLNDGGSGASNSTGESGGTTAAELDKKFYNNPMGAATCYGSTNAPPNTLTHCGYLYNWYAATGGAGGYGQNAAGVNVTASICPAGFRLPSATSGTGGPTTTGTATSASDIPVLNASMNAGGLAAGSAGLTSSNWLPSGRWGGAYNGAWFGGTMSSVGTNGFYWTSTVEGSRTAKTLNFTSSAAGQGTATTDSGMAVRCVMQ